MSEIECVECGAAPDEPCDCGENHYGAAAWDQMIGRSKLADALRRIAAATPQNANADTLPGFMNHIRAIAETALEGEPLRKNCQSPGASRAEGEQASKNTTPQGEES